MHRIKLSILLALLFLPAAWPQASTTTVRGTVHDQAQAVVPKANVTLTNTATNVARTTETNEAGLYVFPGVIPGPYRVSVEFPGMQKYDASLTVQAQQDATVDIVLQVGQTSTQLEVKDVTPLVTMGNPTLGHTLERVRIEQLPINGRSFSALLATVPGIEFGNSNASGRVQSYGMRVNSNTTTFDGAPVNEVWEGYDFGRGPGLDALQEVHVETNNSSAKFSRPNTILMSSKSGTNQLHGALFETNRNSGYGVARRRQDNFTKAPYLNRNEYGASLGGPVFIPKLYNGKNRTFFFVAYEASRSVSYATNTYNVPTDAMRAGDFTALKDSQGRLLQLYDPLTTNPTTWVRQPLQYNGVTNMIDPKRITNLANFIFNMSPHANLPGVNPLIDVNLSMPVATPNTQDTTTVRIDHRISDKDLLFGRITRGRNDHLLNITPMLSSGIGTFQPTVTSNRHWPNTTAALTLEHTFSSTLTSETLLNISRDYHRRGSGDFQTDYGTALGLPNPLGAFNWPSISDMDLGSYPFGTQDPFWLITNYGMFQENLTKIHGKHELQFGLHVKYERIDKSAVSTDGPFSAATLGTALYDTTSTATNPLAKPQTGFGLANFELGDLNYSEMFRRPWYHVRRHEWDPYFQDNWKLTNRLTVNVGLRYEMRTPAYDRDGTAMAFDQSKHAIVIGTDVASFLKTGATTPAILGALKNFGGNVISYQDAVLPQHLANMNWKEFGPRLGFAYRAFEGKKSFVLRGGYRMSYYPMRLQEWILGQSDSIPVGAAFQNTVSVTALSPDGLPNYGLRTVPQYTAGVNTPSSIINFNDTRLLSRGFPLTVRDPSLSDGRVQDWNLTLEKEVMADTVIRIGYVGNYGDHQQQAVRVNDQTPAYIWYATNHTPLPTGEFASVATRPYDQSSYGDITSYTPLAYGRYNGAEFQLERRYSKGFSYQILWNTGNSVWVGRDNVDVPGTDNVPSANTFLPGTVPTDLAARTAFLNKERGPNTLKHQIRWNFLVDLPFGKGKKLLGSSHGVVQALVGGWQVAGIGTSKTSWWTLPTTIYPNGNALETYGYQYKIQDCTSGTCYPGYLWWNGYIPANKINSVDANGKPNGIEGVPANYKPAAAYLIPYGSTTLPANAPANTVLSQFWDTNNVWIPLNGSSTPQRVVYNNNLHPWRNQYMPGPWQWTQDASAFKFWSIRERMNLRFNFDAFNIFNHPNNPTAIADTGILSTRNSGVNARVVQLGLRLAW